MTIKIGLKGFGRVGKCIFRHIIENSDWDMELVAVSEWNPYKAYSNEEYVRNHIGLLCFDSHYGKFPKQLGSVKKISDDLYNFEVEGKEIPIYLNRDIQDVPWAEHDVDILVEASLTPEKGTNKEQIDQLRSCVRDSVKAVVITKTHPFADKVIVVGANEEGYDPKKHKVVSANTCTGNAAAPIIKLIHNSEYGPVIGGDLETTHPNQGFESPIDKPYPDPGMGRASINSIKDVETKVVKSVESALPELKNVFMQRPMSQRVPVDGGSVIRYHLITKNPIPSADDLNKLIKDASEKQLSGIVSYGCKKYNLNPNNREVVGNPSSVLIIPDRTEVQNIDCCSDKLGHLRLRGLHDTEYGYAACVLRTIQVMARNGL